MKHKLQDKICEIAFTDFRITTGVYCYKKHVITIKPTIKQVI